MWTPGIDGGWVFPATLADELVEPMAEVLHLARSQDTTHPHQLAVMRVVVAARSCVGMAPSSPHSLHHRRGLAGSCPCKARREEGSHSWRWLVTQESRRPFWGWARGWSWYIDTCWWWGSVIALVRTLIQEVRAEEKRRIMSKKRLRDQLMSLSLQLYYYCHLTMTKLRLHSDQTSWYDKTGTPVWCQDVCSHVTGCHKTTASYDGQTLR